MLVGRQLSCTPDPLAIAASLRDAGADRVALLHASDRTPGTFARYSFIACDPDLRSDKLDPSQDDPDMQRAGELGEFRAAPRWIGVLPYDAFRHLERPGWARSDVRSPALVEQPMWLRYPASIVVDHDHGRVFAVGITRQHAEDLAKKVRTNFFSEKFAAPERNSVHVRVEDSESPMLHIERIRAAKELIGRGELYQVNLARRLRVSLLQGDPLHMYAKLAKAAPSPFGAYLELDRDLTVISTSPELLLRAETNLSTNSITFGRLYTCPIKGTRPRGKRADQDASLVRDLDEDPKENAELTMIIDVERNDLGRVAAPGSVRVIRGPEVVTHRTVHHREALLTAFTKKTASRLDVLEAMLPSGSVTGAPKVRAMEVIADLEAHRRGLYTGGFGLLSHDGAMTLAMAIRTVVLREREGEYFTGGGIVADSNPDRELEETRWKAIQLEKVAQS